jgi:hypothetical protein
VGIHEEVCDVDLSYASIGGGQWSEYKPPVRQLEHALASIMPQADSNNNDLGYVSSDVASVVTGTHNPNSPKLIEQEEEGKINSSIEHRDKGIFRVFDIRHPGKPLPQEDEWHHVGGQDIPDVPALGARGHCGRMAGQGERARVGRGRTGRGDRDGVPERCRFFNTAGGCRKGAFCAFIHG